MMKNPEIIKVYYLDDEPELCEMFSDIFSSDAIKVTTFSNPQVAIETIKKSPPDMFFVDYRLPSTNGDKIALQLDPSIPKFLITGDISVATTYKFNRIFSKPYREEDIRVELDKFVRS